MKNGFVNTVCFVVDNSGEIKGDKPKFFFGKSSGVMNRDLCNEVKLEFGASEHDLGLWNEVKLALRVMDAWNVPGRMVNCLLDARRMRG